LLKSEWNKFDMGIETNVSRMAGHTFKLVCEQCGSLTVALPIEAQPDPCSILKCGRCGSPRGTLQSLRDTSIQAGIRHPV
jgi:ribosomal protein S27AE